MGGAVGGVDTQGQARTSAAVGRCCGSRESNLASSDLKPKLDGGSGRVRERREGRGVSVEVGSIFLAIKRSSSLFAVLVGKPNTPRY